MKPPAPIHTARAVAHANIALVKYWGKRPGAADLNLPAVGSLSMTLDRLRSETVVAPGERDSFALDGRARAGAEARKVYEHLDRVWRASGAASPRPGCRVESINHLPTAAGLASSASGFAALTLAAAAAFGLELDRPRLSGLARRGSGSAARSLWGGFVRLDRGARDDGEDCLARPLYPADHWALRLLVVHTARGPKPIGSTDGMTRCRETSPYFDAWVATSERDLDDAEAALAARDLAALGEVVERSMFKMHACMMATRPPILYWNGATLAVIHALTALREEGLSGFATSDAGPHVKVLCAAADSERLAARLADVAGVLEVEAVDPGPDASVEVLA
ncbi:MAG: diphosphomevalonate decarboxylase [Myxococcales bacterium]|nr:diphosphomevalonate decarboxylase [Myxococcales bacterium]